MNTRPHRTRAEQDSIDETARLLLMESPSMRLLDLYRALKGHHPDFSSSENADIWARYRGFDGRRAPTHDVESGQPIRASTAQTRRTPQ